MSPIHVTLPHGRCAQLDAFARRLPNGRIQRRWVLLGRMPSARGVRPTLAAGSVGPGGSCVVDYGCASLEVLEALQLAATSSRLGL